MTALLEVRGLRVDYGDAAVLKGVDLDIQQGEFATLIGPNGSGKTTLLRAIVDMVPLTGGSIRIDGHDLSTASRAAKTAVGFMVEPERLPRLLTGRECLELFVGARGLPSIPQATYTLSEALAMSPLLDRRVENYSLGMRQKLGIL
ncbi:MAG: ATP-binding cassette domain-containing protein, partial [Rhodanobacteraceae bacterium]